MHVSSLPDKLLLDSHILPSGMIGTEDNSLRMIRETMSHIEGRVKKGDFEEVSFATHINVQQSLNSGILGQGQQPFILLKRD